MPRKEFIERLKALLADADVRLYGDDQYDGEEAFVGTKWSFRSEEWEVEIDDRLERVVKST